MKSKTLKTGPKSAQRSLILLVALSVLAASLVAHSAAFPTRGDIRVQENPSPVVAAFEVAVNTHNVEVALAFFTNDAVVLDPSNIACLYGPTNIRCQPLVMEARYTSKAQIRGWLQLLAQENIQVREIGALQSTGNNVTWTWEVSVDEYRRLNVAPLVGTGEAIVQGNMIKYLKFVLNVDSQKKLQAAFVTARQSPYSVAASGFAVGIVGLGLVFPAVAVYYISRVKSLFAAVPRLERPWLLLQGGVASLFVALLVLVVNGALGFRASSLDTAQYLLVVVAAAFVLAAMMFMKRVWTIKPGEDSH